MLAVRQSVCPVCSVFKTKSVVAKSRINESGLKFGELMNRRIKREGTHYPVPSEVKVRCEQRAGDDIGN
jgi:hypothetical protein